MPGWRLADKSCRPLGDIGRQLNEMLPEVAAEGRTISGPRPTNSRRWKPPRSPSEPPARCSRRSRVATPSSARRIIEAHLNICAFLADPSGAYALRSSKGERRSWQRYRSGTAVAASTSSPSHHLVSIGPHSKRTDPTSSTSEPQGWADSGSGRRPRGSPPGLVVSWRSTASRSSGSGDHRLRAPRACLTAPSPAHSGEQSDNSWTSTGGASRHPKKRPRMDGGSGTGLGLQPSGTRYGRDHPPPEP